MLVLARQRDQTVIIGDDIEVTVVDVRGDKVRLGINAPKHVSVHRKEVYEAIRKENRDAGRLRPDDVPQVGGPPAHPQQQPMMHCTGRMTAPRAAPPSPDSSRRTGRSSKPQLRKPARACRRGACRSGRSWCGTG